MNLERRRNVTTLNKSFQRSTDWYAVGQCDTAGPRRGLERAGAQKVSLPSKMVSFARGSFVEGSFFTCDCEKIGEMASGQGRPAGLRGGKISDSVSGVSK